MKLDDNTLVGVTIITIGAVEIAALMTGHNGDFFNLAIGAMVALAGATPLHKRFGTKRNEASPSSISSE